MILPARNAACLGLGLGDDGWLDLVGAFGDGAKDLCLRSSHSFWCLLGYD